MISDTSRKHINYASLTSVLLLMVSMFIVFFSFGSLIIVQLILKAAVQVSIIWLSYGLFLFYKEETNKTVLYSIIALFSGGLASLPLLIVRGLLSYDIIPYTETAGLVVQIVSLVPIIGYIVGFVLLRGVLDNFVREKRNIFRGQISLPLGYLFNLIYVVILSIIPLDQILVEAADGTLEIIAGKEFLYYALNFLDMGRIILTVLGFWYLRRAFVLLDKVPPELLERMQQRAQASRTGFPRANQQGSTSSGGFIPMTAVNGEGEGTIIDLEEDSALKKKMFCVKCGLELEDDAVFCGNCGEVNPYIKKE